jgi:hypothetical protein
MARKKPEDLRSYRWMGPQTMRAFGHRSRVKQMGYDAEDWTGRPIIGIVNTWSDINQCHAHLRDRVADVKRGVLQAGGFPIELPAISLSEPIVKPTTMLYRNFLAMEAEELLRSHPIDGAVSAGRLRQDHAGPAHGRDLDGVADDLLSGRADATRQLARQRCWGPAPIPGSTGMKSAPAISPKRSGTRSEAGSHGRSARA